MRYNNNAFHPNKDEKRQYGLPGYIHESRAPRHAAALFLRARFLEDSVPDLFRNRPGVEGSYIYDMQTERDELYELSTFMFENTDPSHTSLYGLQCIERSLRQESRVY